MTWNPNQYLKFEDHRTRPAVDLIQQIPIEQPQTVVDLGCGTGNITKLLRERWPQAQITGVDNSPQMLAKAQGAAPEITWETGDVATWNPSQKVDVIFSNATFNWLPDHDTLLPQIMQHLTPGGVLAIQVPRNYEAPSHALMQEIAQSGPWTTTLKPLIKAPSVQAPENYYKILSPHAKTLKIWESTYLQALDGVNPVAEFTKGTALKPFLDALDEPLKGQFEAEYRRRVLQAYPPQPDGKTLFPFKRLFIVAQT
jgi:trans-aconitate 2-methyltransferase